MLKSLIIWASDIPGLDIEEDIIHPENKAPTSQDPEKINWWKSFAYTVLYCVGNGVVWDSEPSVVRESKRMLISGQILNPSPWITKANLSVSIQPNKDRGYLCTLWYENSEYSPASIERSWSCYAPKGDTEKVNKLIRSVYTALQNAFTDYKLDLILE